jgi:CheY-like chemotaxis protein
MIDERIGVEFATSPAHRQRRLIAVGLATAAYFGIFALLAPSLGGAVTGLSIIPVGIVAWLYGMRAGIVAGLVGFPLQVLGFALALDDGWTLGLVAKVAPGTIGVVLAGAAVGRLCDLHLRLQTQATLHDRANAALLLESEITSHMAEGVFLSRTSDGVIVFTNAKLDEMFGYAEGMEGTGLGLAVVHGIVDRHGGTLEIESEPGKGTTVTIRFPVLHDEIVFPAEPVEMMSQVKGTSHRILVVDDDLRALEAVANVLDAERHAVEIAGSGGDALDKILVQPFDIVVTDRAMPGMNGDQLATAVKLVKPEVGVIMLTGFGEMMATAGEAPRDVDLVVSKPVTVSTLRDALSEVVAS